jgi:hypothetical protein
MLRQIWQPCLYLSLGKRFYMATGRRITADLTTVCATLEPYKATIQSAGRGS